MRRPKHNRNHKYFMKWHIDYPDSVPVVFMKHSAAREVEEQRYPSHLALRFSVPSLPALYLLYEDNWGRVSWFPLYDVFSRDHCHEPRITNIFQLLLFCFAFSCSFSLFRLCLSVAVIPSGNIVFTSFYALYLLIWWSELSGLVCLRIELKPFWQTN